MTIISKEEKANIIAARQKTIFYNKYNLELNLVEENAKVVPNIANIRSINEQMADIDRQAQALVAELATVNALVE